MEAIITRLRCDGCGKVEESAEGPVFGGEDFVGWLALEGGGRRNRWRKNFCGAACLFQQTSWSLEAPPASVLSSLQAAVMGALSEKQGL